MQEPETSQTRDEARPTGTARRPNRNPPISKIEDGLYLGDLLSSHQVHILEENKITAIVSLQVGGLAYWRRDRNRALVPESRHYCYVLCPDTMTHDLLPELAPICDFIERCTRSDSLNSRESPTIDSKDSSNSTEASLNSCLNVLVHCSRGVSRSATAVIAYLMRTHHWPLDVALAFVKERRKINPNKNFQEQLTVWGEVGYEIWEDPEHTVPKPAYATYLQERAKRLKELGLTGNEPILPFFKR